MAFSSTTASVSAPPSTDMTTALTKTPSTSMASTNMSGPSSASASSSLSSPTTINITTNINATTTTTQTTSTASTESPTTTAITSTTTHVSGSPESGSSSAPTSAPATTPARQLTRSQSLPHLLSLPASLSTSNDVARSITESEFERMGFSHDNNWRITDINQDFKLCNTYPRFLILPSSVKEEDLNAVAKFRNFGRIPTAVWRHTKNGCFIARSSQPSVGWFGWRNEQDENLLQAFVDNSTSNSEYPVRQSAQTPDQRQTTNAIINNSNNTDSPSPISASSSSSRLLIVDARSYTAAVANRAKGGGCECSEYYQRCEVQFMNLANIHSIRKSFHAIKSVCESYSEQSNNWLSLLENSRWLHHISGLLKSALIVVETIDLEEKSTLIHCSDGWDRTPQIVALAEIMLDPFYRTFDGFRILIQREWLDFGHKFADRCGNSPNCDDPNERCPVFLQWLDCVHQLLSQFPTHFEFNSHYLVKLINHTYSCVFGTFLCNSPQERIINRIDDKTFSVWSYFESSRNRFVNEHYFPKSEVLRPSCKVKELCFWKEVYLPSLRTSVGGGSTSTGNGTPANAPSTIFDLDRSTTADNSAPVVQAKMNLLAHKLQGTQIASSLRISQQDPIATLKTILRI